MVQTGLTRVLNQTKPTHPFNIPSEGGHFDNSQIVETKDFSEEAISKTDFIGNDQSYVTKTEMTKILPIGTLGACEALVNY
ncbi:5834_t:CDS:1, partial [Entrophospora sp. SA101]